MTKVNNTLDPVLQKFRAKFVGITMSFVLVLMLAVLVVAAYMTYTQHLNEINDELTTRVNRLSDMPAEMLLENIQFLQDLGFDMNVGFDGSMGPGGKRERGERRESGADPLVVTSDYLVSHEGEIMLVVSNSLALDDDTVEEAIEDVLDEMELDNASMARGRITNLNLFYQIRETLSGYSVCLASGNYVDKALGSLVKAVGLAEAAAFLLLFVLSVFLSRWVVGPVERAWNQQRQFIADASHELKTPLSVIRANDSLLMADPSASVGSQMQWIESTEAEANLMQNLVNDMLLLAQAENMQNETVMSSVDFTEVVQAAVLQFESVAFERGVVMDCDIAEDVQVVGEAKSLNRLVGTLIDNACKYAQDGGQVDVDLRKQGGQCVLRVHNTGEPIPAQDLNHVFDRFYRSDKARTREQGGFGLGLAIAKSIAEEHKGNITVASSALDGTSFSVFLPLG